MEKDQEEGAGGMRLEEEKAFNIFGYNENSRLLSPKITYAILMSHRHPTAVPSRECGNIKCN